ncbi:hypothetical protein UlMin_034091 [Ulmus minor]
MMQSSASMEFTEDDFEVCGILVELSNRILENETFSVQVNDWGLKRKRSAVRNKFSSSSPPPLMRLSNPPAPSPSPEPEPEPEPKRIKGEASSPATPLSFSPSESDEKSKPSKRKVQKRNLEEQQENVRKCTEHRDLIEREVENVKNYYLKLMAENLRLKERKIELSDLHIRKSEIEKSLNLQMDLGEPEVKSVWSDVQEKNRPLSMMNQPLEGREIGENFSQVSSEPKTLNPVGLPDLNMSWEDLTGVGCFQQYNETRANKNRDKEMAAEARRKRLQICRSKYSFKLR